MRDLSDRELGGWGWGVVIAFILLAAAVGQVAHCTPDEGTYMPASAHKPSVDEGSTSVDACCERAMAEDATAGKGPAQSLTQL